MKIHLQMLLVSAVATTLLFGAAACSTAGAKVVKHEVKKAVPGVDTKGEKLSKKADKVGSRDDQKPGLLDR